MAVILNYILQHILIINILNISDEIALRWILQDFTDHMWSLLQVMSWVPSSNKPLLKPMLTQIYISIWHDKELNCISNVTHPNCRGKSNNTQVVTLKDLQTNELSNEDVLLKINTCHVYDTLGHYTPIVEPYTVVCFNSVSTRTSNVCKTLS